MLIATGPLINVTTSKTSQKKSHQFMEGQKQERHHAGTGAAPLAAHTMFESNEMAGATLKCSADAVRDH